MILINNVIASVAKQSIIGCRVAFQAPRNDGEKIYE